MIIINPSMLKVFFPWILWKGPSDSNEVALTFDDGPHPEYTPRTIKILDRFNAKAAFFLKGRNVLANPGIVEKLKAGGHTIGSHGFSHQRLDFRKKGTVLDEITASVRAVEKITGERPAYFRPPYGRFDWRFKKIMKEQNLRMVLWSLLTCDFRETEPASVTRIVRDNVAGGSILVFHDGHVNAPVMLEALPGILDTLRQIGYSTAALDRWTKNTES
jgi:peptidoglycan/xylan/chitin deacetylase (PgdA/CDA1 family)